MKTILVPVDFSKDSINALEQAIIFANQFNAAVRMIHVKKKENFDPTFVEDSESIGINTVKDYFAILMQRYQDKIHDGLLDYKIREGLIYKEITNQAKYDDAYFIIMGTHGVSGFQEYWIGSNAFRVASNAECPVITIRYGYRAEKLDKIVLPIDVSYGTRLKVPYVADLASRINAEILVAAVYETSQKDVIARVNQYGKQAYDFVASRGVSCSFHSLKGKNISDVTIKLARDEGAQLIAIMTEQTENPRNIWLGSYAQQMVNHSPTPVMSLKTNFFDEDE